VPFLTIPQRRVHQSNLSLSLNMCRSKTRVKTTTSLCPLLDDSDVLVCDDNEMGEMIFFAFVFTPECQDNLPSAKQMLKIDL